MDLTSLGYVVSQEQVIIFRSCFSVNRSILIAFVLRGIKIKVGRAITIYSDI